LIHFYKRYQDHVQAIPELFHQAGQAQRAD